MKQDPSNDPYLEVIQHFNQRGVRYVVVGMSGINYYAKDLAQTFSTMDYDFFIDSTLGNVAKAIEALKKLKFTLGTSEGALKMEELKDWVRDRRTITATTSSGVMVELLLEVSGFPFSELAKDAATFTIDGIPVKVGRLKKLIHSKRIADRPKDRQFLKRYEALIDEKEV